MIWSAQSLTAVIFTLPVPVTGSAFDIFRDIFGHAPKTFNDSEQISGPSSHATGPTDYGTVRVTLQLGRVDIVLSPIENPQGPTAGLQLLQDVNGGLSFLLGLAQKGCLILSPIRLAMIGNLALQATDVTDALHLFREATKLHSIPDAASDAQFGFNLRKPMNLAGWDMNRLRNWGMGKMQWMQMSMGPAGPSHKVVDGTHFATLTADINTVPRRGTFFDSETASQAFAELASELRQIISEEDVSFTSPE